MRRAGLPPLCPFPHSLPTNAFGTSSAALSKRARLKSLDLRENRATKLCASRLWGLVGALCARFPGVALFCFVLNCIALDI